jgi:uncharacterized membrane protein
MSVRFGLNLLLLLTAGLALAGAASAQNDEAGGERAFMPPAPDWFDQVLHGAGRAIEAAGIAVIVVGVVVSTLHFLWRLRQSGALAETYDAYRANLGRGILLGLEFLVAADIIGTVAVEPTLQNLSVLGLIVLIRTFLSFSLEVEIEGRWPWQKAPRTDKTPGSP